MLWHIVLNWFGQFIQPEKMADTLYFSPEILITKGHLLCPVFFAIAAVKSDNIFFEFKYFFWNLQFNCLFSRQYKLLLQGCYHRCLPLQMICNITYLALHALVLMINRFICTSVWYFLPVLSFSLTVRLTKVIVDSLSRLWGWDILWDTSFWSNHCWMMISS